MKVIDPGHTYSLRSLDGNGDVRLRFVKRQGPGYPGNIGRHSGTTTQEVVRALIDRTKYVDKQIPNQRNVQVLYHLRSILLELERGLQKDIIVHYRCLISIVSKINPLVKNAITSAV
jgi:hypothetical protein